MESMRVDPQSLMSETTGTLHTMVGRQEVGAVKRTFRFDWNYTGVELRLIGFGIVVPNKPGEDAPRSEEHTSDSVTNAQIVCRLLLVTKKMPTIPALKSTQQ